MARRTAKADVTPVRQRTQYTCMSTSLMMCLQALGYDVDEDEVNKVMGARPMKGAAWEQALAAAQHFGVRGTLVTPSTVRQLKEWTDAGKPVMIAWNPEGREWSHASVVFDVTPCKEHGFDVHVADPNIPDPDETVRVMPKSEFYKKWYEKWPNYLVRRPALMLDREITPDGRQVMAFKKASSRGWEKTIASWSKEYKTPEGKVLGTVVIDRGKVNWRPNQLIEGFVRPQVISRSRSGEEIPSNEKLTSVADAWVRKNHGRQVMASGSADPSRVAARYASRCASGDKALWAGRRKPTSGEVEWAKNAKWQDWEPHPLPDDLTKFFKRTPDTIEVGLSEITPIRAREKGIANANRFMWLAYWGKMPRRKPISLRENDDGTYTILDGNSTYANAKMSGWRHMWGRVEESPSTTRLSRRIP